MNNLVLASATALAAAITVTVTATVTVTGLAGCDSGSSSTSRSIPLQPGSQWPKFRRDAAQTGRTPMRPPTTGGALWDFKTGKGIFQPGHRRRRDHLHRLGRSDLLCHQPRRQPALEVPDRRHHRLGRAAR